MNQSAIDKVLQLLNNLHLIPDYRDDSGEIVITVGQHIGGSARYIDVAFKTVQREKLNESSLARIVEQKIDRSIVNKLL